LDLKEKEVYMNTALQLANEAVWVVFGVFIILLACRSKKITGFVRTLIIVCFSIRTVLLIPEMLAMLNIWRYYESGLNPAIQTCWIFSYFLILYTLTFFLGIDDVKKETGSKAFTAKPRNLWISLALFIFTLGVYFFFWLHRTVRDIKENSNEVSYSPGQAAGFLFIPVFNIFWIVKIVITLPSAIRNIEKKQTGSDPFFRFHPALISSLWFLFGCISNLAGIRYRFHDLPFKETLSAMLFPSLAVIALLLTMQAKINSFIHKK
jgi:hypothetical protein